MLAAVDPGSPARRLDYKETVNGLKPVAGAHLLRAAADWEAFWAASRQRDAGCLSCPLPVTPALDWAAESVVLLAETGTGQLTPLLAAASATRVVAVQPQLADGHGSAQAISTSMRVYAVPRLAADATVDYTCVSAVACPPGGAAPLPSPEPFDFVRGDKLKVGEALDLPAGVAGDPLTWSLAPRTAARAKLAGRRLTPTAPGPLVLLAKAGGGEAQVLYAVQAERATARLISYFGNNRLTGPKMATDAAAWQGLWDAFYYEAHPGREGGGPAPAPGLSGQYGDTLVAFPTHVVVAVPAALSMPSWGQNQLPIATYIEGGMVHLVAAGRPRPGRAAGPTAARASRRRAARELDLAVRGAGRRGRQRARRRARRLPGG